MTTNKNGPEYNDIEEMIHSDDSPVGIDAKKTHVLILQKLISIESRLEQLEEHIKHEPS
jgi:hypothetical protein